MEVNSIHEAKAKLSKLVALALEGEEVILGKAGKPLVTLVPYRPNHAPRKGGQWKGKVRISADFDETSSEIEALFGLPCQVEKLPILTRDAKFKLCPIKITAA